MTAVEDQVGIDDTFDVRVYGEAELSGTFRVATDGTHRLPAGRPNSGHRAAHGRDSEFLVAKLKDGT